MARSTAVVIAGVSVILATLLYFIAFVSPYWLISQPRASNSFQRLGLWEACLKDYIDPKDYVSKLYNGCWWIFWPEYRELRYWLNPGWFVAIQVIAAFNLIVIFIAMFIIAGMMCRCCSDESNKNILTGFAMVFSSSMMSGIEAILFGLGSIDRTWMPKSDYNDLSWGFWLHVLGGFFAFISATAMLSNYCNREDDEDKRSF